MRLTITDLEPMTTYGISARASAEGQFSEWSPISYYETPGDPTPPGNVTGLVATAGYDQINLTWDVADRAAFYRVYQGTTIGTVTSLVGSPTSNSFTFSTVAWTTDNFFKVVAVSLFNIESLVPAVTTIAVRPKTSLGVDAVAPGAVSGAAVSAPPTGSFPGVTLTWNRNTETDVDHYTIRYSTSSSGPWNTVVVPQETSGSTMTYVQRLPSPGSYYFQILVQDFVANKPGWTNFSPYPYTVTGNTTPPAAPSNVVFFDGFNSMTIKWDENSEPDVKWGAGQYEVQVDGYASSGTTPTWSGTNFKSVLTGAPGATVSGLTPNLYYNIRVRAINSSGTAGSWSTVVQNNLGSPIDDVPAFSVPADKLQTNLLITSNITLNQDTPNGRFGYIQSSDYNNTTGVGFRLGSTSLDIQSGSINARALLIQDSNNIVPSYYADFEFRTDFYTGRVTTTGTSWAIITPFIPFNGTQALRVISGGSPAVTTLGSSTTDYNTKVESSTSYIVSVWVFNNSGSAQTITLGLKSNDGSTYTATAVAPNNATFFQRISAVVTVGSTTTLVCTQITQPASLTLYYDGIQIEKKIGALTTPSQWKPPGNTSIDGATIRTGSIQSTTTVDIDGSGNPQPLWSINTQAGLVVNDALVRGKLIVGLGSGITNVSSSGATALTTNANTGIYSGSWGGVGPQWAITGDGQFSLKSGATTGISITPDAISTSDVSPLSKSQISSNGDVWFGAIQPLGYFRTATTPAVAVLTTGGSMVGGSGTHYYYVVQHVDSYGNPGQPSAQSDLVGPSSGTTNRITVTWTNTSRTGRYDTTLGTLRILRKSIAGVWVILASGLPPTTTSYTDTGSVSGTPTIAPTDSTRAGYFYDGSDQNNTILSGNVALIGALSMYGNTYMFLDATASNGGGILLDPVTKKISVTNGTSDEIKSGGLYTTEGIAAYSGYPGIGFHFGSLRVDSPSYNNTQSPASLILSSGINLSANGGVGPTEPTTAELQADEINFTTTSGSPGSVKINSKPFAGGIAGSFGATTDASGILAVTHNLGTTSHSIVCMSNYGTELAFRLISRGVNTDNISVRRVDTGALVASTSVTVFYMAAPI